MSETPDDTIRLRTTVSQRRRALPAVIGSVLAVAIGTAGWLVLSPHSPPPVLQPGLQPAPAPEVASEDELLDRWVATTTLFQLRENPRVFVLLFPTLDVQGQALNRIAALVEKAGLPRDRLLDDAALQAAMQAAGDTPGTWYLGHDYAGQDIKRFFDLAARDSVPLNAAEQAIMADFARARALVDPTEEIALISVANPEPRADAALRRAILRHEVGHGHFFTRPDISRHVMAVWRDRFREPARESMRRFLGREGYDTTNERLLANEAMAYLMFTPDRKLFSGHQIGLPEVEVDQLRLLMRDGFPPL